MKYLTIIIIMLNLLASCATPSRLDSTYSSKGEKISKVSCDGQEESIANCYDKAGQKCKNKGYEIFSTNKNMKEDKDGNTLWIRTLSFKCKKL